VLGKVFGNVILRRDGVSEIITAAGLNSPEGQSFVTFDEESFFHGVFLPPDFNGYVRAGLGAKRTASAFIIRAGFGGIKTLKVGFFAENDQLFRAG
jgi:hypothetical protein